MKKKLIILGIHLTVVALVLILTMVTLAWYTKNETANTSSAVITAESSDDTGLSDIVDNILHYQGQTGLGGEFDAPYIATKIIKVTQDSTFVDDAVTCELSSVRVEKADGKTIIDKTTNGFENIVDFFTMRVKVVELNDDNTVSTIKGTFYPNSDGILVNSNGEALHYQDSNYFTISPSEKPNKQTCITYIQLELIFLDETSYSRYTTPDNTEPITAFKFSDYEYMGSTFYTTFTVGIEEGSSL